MAVLKKYNTSTSAWEAVAVGSVGPAGATYNSTTTDATTARTLALTDADSLILFSSTSAITVTVPTYASVAIGVGQGISLVAYGGGQITVASAVGVTLRYTNTLRSRTQYSILTLIKIDTNEWLVTGDTAAY